VGLCVDHVWNHSHSEPYSVHDHVGKLAVISGVGAKVPTHVRHCAVLTGTVCLIVLSYCTWTLTDHAGVLCQSPQCVLLSIASAAVS
jgi:hypothetical protein